MGYHRSNVKRRRRWARLVFLAEMRPSFARWCGIEDEERWAARQAVRGAKGSC